MSIHLITQYFEHDNRDRQEEIDYCLNMNLRNKFISRVHLLNEKYFIFSMFSNYKKIRQIVINERLTFLAAFEYANKYQDQDNILWILCNSDIYFDDSLENIKKYRMHNKLFALTRYDIQNDRSIKFLDSDFAHGSQDAWIFESPIPLNKIFTNFYLGIPGCDNRIAYEFIRAGYNVINPSKKIIAKHFDLARDMRTTHRNALYSNLNTEDNIKKGLVAPPPYQFFIYPTDKLDSSYPHLSELHQKANKSKYSSIKVILLKLIEYLFVLLRIHKK